MIQLPWGPVDPNSQHQLWSRWTFKIYSSKIIAISEVKLNAARWLRKGFGSVGRAKVTLETSNGQSYIQIVAEVEGVAAHDPDYKLSVRRGLRRFVEQGWGSLAWEVMSVEILAGDVQDGKPRSQLIVIPKLKLM